MAMTRKITCLWPGLPRLWVCGEMSALRLALGFTVLLNLALVTTFLWPWRFPTILTVLLWALVGGIWAACFWGAWRQFPNPPTENATIYEDLFLRAQAEYLRGEHFAAEAALDRLLRRRPQDIEARLLLASVYRRTDRFEEARKQLRRLARTGGARWALEVSREMQFLDATEAAQNPDPPLTTDLMTTALADGETETQLTDANLTNTTLPEATSESTLSANSQSPLSATEDDIANREEAA